MNRIESLIQQLDQSRNDVFWQGGTSCESINKLESLLGLQLPASLKGFLHACGGGGVVEQELSGIEDNDPTLQHRGTIYGDTLRCREDYALPKHLIVIYLGADDVVWCLDASDFDEEECPVVSFDVFSGSTRPFAINFFQFFAHYVMLRISC